MPSKALELIIRRVKQLEMDAWLVMNITSQPKYCYSSEDKIPSSET